MPSPSENKAIDLICAAFPGTLIVTPDRTHRLPLPPAENEGRMLSDLDRVMREDGKVVKPKKNPRGKKGPRNMEGLF